jgi:hypothetical protein
MLKPSSSNIKRQTRPKQGERPSRKGQRGSLISRSMPWSRLANMSVGWYTGEQRTRGRKLLLHTSNDRSDSPGPLVHND